METLPSTSTGPSTSLQATLKPGSVTSYPTLRAEICWAVKVVTSQYSYKSCEDVGDVFRTMFPDSDIAKNFNCDEERVGYLTTFGIAPHFSSLMKSRAAEESEYVLHFDQRFNIEMEKRQLDVNIRFWNDNQIKTRYLTSLSMDHQTAEQMCSEIKKACTEIGFHKLLQLSLDGSKVDWKLFSKVQENIESETGKKMLDVGSCGLHVLHNSFRSGCVSTKWKLSSALKSLKDLFKEESVQRDFTEVTGSTSFPLDFCNNRWIENVIVAERVLQILPSIKAYVKAVKAKKIKEPATFRAVQEIVEDDLLPAKLHSSSCELRDLLHSLMKKFIKPCVMTSAVELTQVDVCDPENHVDVTRLKRIICDHVQHVGGLCNIDYSKELLMSAADAKEKYDRYCEDHLRLQKNKQNVKKRKRFEEEVREIRMKKQKVEEDIKDLLKSADKKAEKAEKQGNLSFLSKSNELRRAAKKKQTTL
ncbi:hypothetical protein WMY93_032594 [Mugilogobius chulae]|uniref:Uncharacterized protein n=1 Tax=Mugilogobius chulae TaxID=88201 RepID=A0AAW0MRF8_9GOBI